MASLRILALLLVLAFCIFLTVEGAPSPWSSYRRAAYRAPRYYSPVRVYHGGWYDDNSREIYGRSARLYHGGWYGDDSFESFGRDDNSIEGYW